MTFSLPDALAQRFLAVIPHRKRSPTIARLLEKELAKRDSELAAACRDANDDKRLSAEIAEWQEFEDDSEESSV